jgi:hypothetical protein
VQCSSFSLASFVGVDAAWTMQTWYTQTDMCIPTAERRELQLQFIFGPSRYIQRERNVEREIERERERALNVGAQDFVKTDGLDGRDLRMGLLTQLCEADPTAHNIH